MTRSGYVMIANDIGGSEQAVELADDLYLASIGLFVLCIAYCDRQRSNGDIPRKAMGRSIAPGIDCTATVAELQRVGLLKRTKSGWTIPNYLAWQRSKEQIEAGAEQRRRAGIASATARGVNQSEDITRQTDIHTYSAVDGALNESLNGSLNEPLVTFEEFDR